MTTNDNPLSTDKLDGFYGLEIFDSKGRMHTRPLRAGSPDDLAYRFRSLVSSVRQKSGYGWRLIRVDTGEVLNDVTIFGPTMWRVGPGWIIPGRENE